MAVKDTVIVTTKRLVAEIVGDGALADEGWRQTSGAAPNFSPNDRPASGRGRDAPSTKIGSSYAPATSEHNRFALLLGNAALSLWPDLPRDAQEQLFAAAAEGTLWPMLSRSSCMNIIQRRPIQQRLPRLEYFR